MHGELAFMHSAKEYDYECTIVRYQNIIGPEMGFGHAIPHIVERFAKKKNPHLKFMVIIRQGHFVLLMMQ